MRILSVCSFSVEPKDPLNSITWIFQQPGNQVGTATQVLTFTSRHLLAASCILIHSGRPRLWVSMTQCPAAKLLGVPPCSLGTTQICISSYCLVHTLTRGVTHFLTSLALSKNLHIKLFYVILSVGTVRVQMTDATPSLPPAVNSLRLGPDNHLPSVALHCNALPHGLITTTLFHL